MKNYDVEQIRNDFWCVSVNPNVRDYVVDSLNQVPYVDEAFALEKEKTKITVRVSALANEEDRKALKRRIERASLVEVEKPEDKLKSEETE